MSEVINLGPIETSNARATGNPNQYFNNLALPPINVSQDIDDAVQAFFQRITGNKSSAQVLASAVIFTAAGQGLNPMATIAEFQRVPPGELNDYLVVFLNLNRFGTSILGINNQPFINQFVKRTLLV
jgi:hypothetical protein